MVVLSILSLALALSMDAMAVAAARGLAAVSVRARDAITIGLFFGGAQALMPLLGWWLGAQVGERLAAWDHWIAFVLLAFIGAKMIKEALSDDDNDAPEAAPFAPGALLVLAIATSIDAFAAGVTLPVLGVPPIPTIAAIGVVTALLSAGAALGARSLARHFGARFAPRLEILGGVVLIGLGIKVLVEHTLL